MIRRTKLIIGATAAVVLASCGGHAEEETQTRTAAVIGDTITVERSVIDATIEAAGTARPYAEATLATKLMGTITAVAVREGDYVQAGAILARIDARDLSAKDGQVRAGIAEAEAMRAEAETHVNRMRTLYREDAASKAQLDAAETAYARSKAAVAAARAADEELGAIAAYSTIRAPFAGTIVRRFVDAGAFAAPGSPLLTIQDARRLRVSVTAAPAAVHAVRRGSQVRALIEDKAVVALVEGVVPTAGSLYTINAIVDNANGAFMPGSAAKLALPLGKREAILIPTHSVIHRGDLTGVYLGTGTSTELRWIRLGQTFEDSVEVLAGLRSGDRIVVPTALAEAR